MRIIIILYLIMENTRVFKVGWAALYFPAKKYNRLHRYLPCGAELHCSSSIF